MTSYFWIRIPLLLSAAIGLGLVIVATAAFFTIQQIRIMSLPFASHPLYLLRKATFASSGIGIIFCIISLLGSISNWNGRPEIWIFALVLLALSLALCAVDVCYYAHEKKRKARDEEYGDPKWPSKKLIVADLAMAVILVWHYLTFLGEITYRSSNEAPFSWYANLAALVSGILHGVAFWRELKIRWQNACIISYQAQAHTCPRCAYEYIDPIPNNDDPHLHNQGPTTPPNDPSPFHPRQHPGLAQIASLVRSLNNQVETDIEVGRSYQGQKSNQAGPSRVEAETEPLIIRGEDEEDRKSNDYGSLEVLTPSSETVCVVGRKKKRPTKSSKKGSREMGDSGKAVEVHEEFGGDDV